MFFLTIHLVQYWRNNRSTTKADTHQ